MFETSLIESEHHGGGSKKALSFPVSVLIHGLVIGIALLVMGIRRPGSPTGTAPVTEVASSAA